MIGRAEIAGGGFAGLAAAIGFARSGWSVRIHERDLVYRPYGAGFFLWENGLAALAEIGLEQRILSFAHAAPKYLNHGPDGAQTGIMQFGSTVGTRMINITRQRLHGAMVEEAKRLGVTFRHASHIIRASPAGSLTAADGQQFEGDVVIGADGINSQVRESLNLTESRRQHALGAIRVVVRSPEPVCGRTACVLSYESRSARRVLYVPCNKHDIYLCLTTSLDDTVGGQLPVDIASWSTDFPWLKSLLDLIGSEGRWDRFETVKLKAWSSDRAVVVGDAAHGMAPTLGQGAGCSVVNGVALARAMTNADSVEAGARAWEAMQRPMTDYTQQYSENLAEGARWRDSASGTKWTADALRPARLWPTQVSATAPS